MRRDRMLQAVGLRQGLFCLSGAIPRERRNEIQKLTKPCVCHTLAYHTTSGNGVDRTRGVRGDPA